MPKQVHGKLADLGALVKEQAEGKLEKEIAKLTQDNEIKFKFLFTHQLEELYNFESLQTLHDPDSKELLTDEERLCLHEYLGSCIDTYTGRTISNVEMHFRRSDEDDTAYDPVGGVDMPVHHFPIDAKEKARVHGYFNKHGYFVVTRLDWFHLYHRRQAKKKNAAA